MIQTLDKLRTEMDGGRIPKFEQQFIAKRKLEDERKRRENRRLERIE